MNFPRLLRGPRRSAGLLLLLSGLFAAGCTVIPQREFQAYRKAFDETRAQSENILADHAAARQSRSNLAALVTLKANPALRARSLADRMDLNRADASVNHGMDDIEVRLQAWAVIASYNEALVAVASGAPSSEIEGAVNGFLAALQKIPVKEVVKAAGEAVPYAGVATVLIEMIQKEVEARRFRQAVLKAEQPMKEFVGLLRQDAALFRKYRVALFNERFDEQESQVFGHADRLRATVAAHGWSAANAKEVNATVALANRNRLLAAGVETFPAIPEASTSPPLPPDAQQGAELADLQTLADGIEREAGEARTTVNELAAYHELMRQYVVLVGEFERSLGEFAAAARTSTGHPPSVAQLQQVLLTIRLAQKIYSETK
jgi:hypothetical protein